MSDILIQSVHAELVQRDLKAQRGRYRQTHWTPDLEDATIKANCQMKGLVQWLADRAEEFTP